jgi:hypothetical protein
LELHAQEIRCRQDDDDRPIVCERLTHGCSCVGGLSLSHVGARAGVADALLERSNSTPLADRISRQAGG